MAKFKLLVTKGSHLVESLNNFQEFLTQLPHDLVELDMEKMSLHRATVINTNKDYTDIYNELVANSQNVDEFMSIKDFNTLYVNVIASSNVRSKNFVKSESKTSSVSTVSSHVDNKDNFQVSLPQLSLPQFSGSFNEYLAFKENFESIIDRANLQPSQKLLYLRSCLKGEAANDIAGLQPTNDNYNIALDILSARYNKPKLIIQSHVRNIFNLKNFSKPSASNLQDLLNNLNKSILCLKNMDIEYDQLVAAFLMHIVSGKVDSETKANLKRYKPSEILSIEDIIKFLEGGVQFLTDVDCDNLLDSLSNANKLNFSRFSSKQNRNFALVTSHNGNGNISCYLCKNDHYVDRCPQFLSLNIKDRLQKIKDLRLCYNCIRHSASKKCTSKFTCKTCHKPHHSLLHIFKANDLNSKCIREPNDPSTSTGIGISPSLTCRDSNYRSITLLSTALVSVTDIEGKSHTARCLLDSGSMNNLIPNKFAKRLKLNIDNIDMAITGVNSNSVNITERILVPLRSNVTSYQTELSCLVITNITSLIPTIPFDKDQLKIPPNVKLADINFNIPGEVDILIGASHFYSLLCVGQFTLEKKSLILQKTKLGYVLAGKWQNFHGKRFSNPLPSLTGCVSDLSLQNLLQRFWEIEEVTPKNKNSLLSSEEKACEKYFENTVFQNDSGRIVVSMAFNEKINNLGNSYSVALKRLSALERKFDKEPLIREQYLQFLREYESMGHMSKITNNEVSKSYYFLPHHAVVREDHLTTKLRVVFDGSAKTDTDISINDCQLLGPVVQSDLFSILLNFRRHIIVVVGDCEKMYRQILINFSQRKYQCILWRESISEPINFYQLNTVTYGLASSSYLATKSLEHIALKNSVQFPRASEIILREFYMDDWISGAPTSKEALELRNEVSSILNSAGLLLRKFLSNDKEVLISNAEQISELFSIPIDSQNSTKTLGLQWDSQNDEISYQYQPNYIYCSVTKRIILSLVSQIFDPLGLISPIVINGKMLIQSLWNEGVSWDESLPMHLQQAWLTFSKDLNHITDLKIPRCTFVSDYLRIELHGFCDASTRAYGACIYVRCFLKESISIQLLCSKSKVAPLKVTTLPRLELSAAVLLAELSNKVRSTFNIVFNSIHYWSDSKITLGWIKSPPSKFKVFVANRIAVIQELTDPKFWFHVSSVENPADLISRGVKTVNLINNSFWFQGPRFLSERFQAGLNDVSGLDFELPEIKQSNIPLTSSIVNEFNSNIFNRFSKFSTLRRVFAYVLRFISKIKPGNNNKICGSLTAKELSNSVSKLVHLCQAERFSNEIKSLSQGDKSIPKNSSLSCLSLFLDSEGILHVGGRLQNTKLNFNKMHPMLLPKGHQLTKLIAHYYHEKLLHCGANQLLAAIREIFWPIAGRNLCRQITRNCITCFKFRPRISLPKMGNLPASRFEVYTPCFTNTGVDFAGPIIIKDRFTRNPKLVKVYIALFVCMTSKAIHLELVTDLSAKSFLDVFKRFIARRGKLKRMFSDNATNFVSASNSIKELYESLKLHDVQQKICNYFSDEGITWKFIPPNSPHFGGIWESNIKSTKTHLFKLLKNSNLNFEELLTILVQIEAILNSRPLSPVSSDPNDYSPLTAGHFLIGKPLTSLPEDDVVHIPTNRLDRYQHRQWLVSQFWRRWSREVLPELQRRLKWTSHRGDQLQIGSLVLMAEANNPPFQWPTARVVELHPGSDGIVRVASVKLPNGNVLKRATVKLCALPTDC